MTDKKTILQQLFGTTTKVKILEHLIMEGDGISRYALSKMVGTGVGPTYNQVDQLIAVGALRESDDKIVLDTSFPFYESIEDLVVSTNDYLDDLRILLQRLDRLYSPDYYISGYLAACQNGFPMDHEQDTVLVALVNPDHRSKRYVNALSECTSTHLRLFPVECIERDIKRIDIYGSEIWLASFERGIVDCIAYDESGIYPVALLLIQNAIKGDVRWDMLLRIAEERGVLDMFSKILREISLTSIEIPEDILTGQKVESDNEVRKTVMNALNTVRGG